MGNGTISANDLMSKLVGARKVMNKVESGNYETGFIDENLLMSGDDNSTYTEETDDRQILSEPKQNLRPVGTPNLDKINQSKLPDAIKRAMIESPIPTSPEISLSDTLDMDFIKGAKRLMEQEGLSTKKQTPQRNTPQSRQTQQNTGSMNSAEIVSLIKPIIENTVRQTISEILDKKLDQILKTQQSVAINENLMIRVGDSVFSGKLTKVNSTKGK